MKKLKRLFAVSICLVLAVSTFLGIKALNKRDGYTIADFHDFEQSVSALLQNDNMTATKLGKNQASVNGIAKTLGLSVSDDGKRLSNKVSGESFVYDGETTNVLDAELLKDLCDDLGYVVYEVAGEYEVFSKYALKRLIVRGDVENTYGANDSVITYKNYNILSYDTERATKIAYEKFVAEGANVSIDMVITAEQVESQTVEYDYSLHNSWGAETIEIGQYRNFLDGSGTDKDVVVVVIDTGINTSHNMFTNRILTDAGGNLVGKTYYTSRYTYSGHAFEDDDGHGTHVSGIICDLTPANVKILPIKVLDYTGHGSTSANDAALLKVYEEYSLTYNIACVNMSLGSDYYSEGFSSLTTMFSNLITERNILPVVAAGNESDFTSNYLPAACENAVVVSALKKTESVVEFDTSYSNFGTQVDIAAPGSRIYSAYISSTNAAGPTNMATLSGTSMATPHASGVVALLCSDSFYYQNEDPSFVAASIEGLLYENAIDLGDSGKDIYYGNGMLSLANYAVEKVNSKIIFKHGETEIDLTQDYYSFNTDMLLTLECEDNSLQIYYTLDGSVPSYQFSSTYIGEIGINKTTTVKAVAYEIGQTGVTKTTSVFTAVLYCADQPLEDYFEINDSGRIMSYTGHFTDLVIPNTIDGIEVKSIDPAVFKGTELISVTIPTTCTTLSGYVFQDCLDLEKVIAPGVEKLYTSVFRNCTKITKVTSEPLSGDEKAVYLPNLKETVSYAFAGCTALETVRLDSLTTINDALFFGCTSLESCEILNATSIPSACFYGCTSLSNFVIGENVEFVGELAFYGIDNNASISVHSSNEYYMADGVALYGRSSLNYLYAKNGGNYKILDKVNIAGTLYSITTIEPCSMMYLTFAELTIPMQINLIGGNAIFECSIGTLVYNAQSVMSSGYISVFEDGSLGIALPFGDTYIQNLKIQPGASKVPERLFQGAYVNNLHISTMNTTLESGVFYFDALGSVYLNFTQSATYDFVSDLNSACTFLTDPDIFAKAEFSDLSITGYYSYGKIGDYYVYSTHNRLQTKFIDYEFKDSVHVYDGNAHNIYINVNENVLDYSIYYGLTAGVYDITNISGNEEFINLVEAKPIFFKISAPGYFDEYGSAILSIKEDLNDAIDIVITLQNQSSIYGENVVVDDTLFFVNKSVNIKNVAIDISTVATKTSNIGKYALTATILNSGGFNITFVNAEYTIIQRSLSVELLPQTSVYGNEINVLQSAYNIIDGTVVNGDNLGLVLATTATNRSNVGRYAISVAFQSNQNYNIDITGGLYQITARYLTVDIEDQVLQYGETALDMIKYALVSGEIVYGDNLGFRLYTVSNVVLEVGSYYIDLTYDNFNYVVEYTRGTLKVDKRDVTIKLEDQRMPYGGTYLSSQTSYEVVSGKIINRDNLNIRLYSDATERSLVGEYGLFATYNNSNYNVSFVTAKLVVVPRNITVELENQTRTYGDERALNQGAYHISQGVVLQGDNLKLSITSGTTFATSVGSYELSATADNVNYNVTVVPAYLTITKMSVIIRISNQHFEYSEDIQIDQTAYTIASGKLITGDDLKVKIKTVDSVVELLPGEKYILEGEWDNENYDVAFIDGEITIAEVSTGFFDSIPSYVIFGVIGVVLILGLIVITKTKKKPEEYK